MVVWRPDVFAQFLVYEPRTTAIIAKNGSGIDRVEDLVGKSVAVNRSGLGEFLLVAALEKHGIDRARVRFIYLNPPDAGPALAAGKVDAWSMWSPGVDIARLQYGAHDVFVEGRDLDFQIDYTSFLVTRSFARDNPDLVRAVSSGLAQETAWSDEHPAEFELMLQQSARYDDAIREQFVQLHRRYRFYPPSDAHFVQQLQGRALKASGGSGRSPHNARMEKNAPPANEGSRRLLAAAAQGARLDKRLWTGIAALTGAQGNSTGLVGTPDQVADAMADYYDLGITTFLIRGFDPLVDAIQYGRELIPRVRALVAARQTVPAAAE